MELSAPAAPPTALVVTDTRLGDDQAIAAQAATSAEIVLVVAGEQRYQVLKSPKTNCCGV